MKGEEAPDGGTPDPGNTESGWRGWIDRVLIRLALFGLRRPGAALAAAALLVAASVLSGLGMQFRSEVTDLAPAASLGPLRRLEEAFGVSDSLFLLVSTRPGSGEMLAEIGKRLSEALRGAPDLRSVSYGWTEMMQRLLSPSILALSPLLTPPEDIAALDRLLTPAGLSAAVHEQALRLDLPGLGQAEQWVERDPLGLGRFLTSRLRAVQGAFRFQPGSLHMISADGSALLVRIEGNVRSSDMERVRTLVGTVRQAANEVKSALLRETPSLPEIVFGYTGGYTFALESEASVKRDLTVTIIGGFILVFGLFAFAMRSAGLLLPAMVPVAVGMVAGFGAFSIFRREVIALSLVAGAILAGMGINFVIHLLVPAFSHRQGPTGEAIIQSTRWSARSLVFESLAAAVAFLAFPLTGERFLSDLGSLSAAGVICTMLASVMLLPALLLPWIRRAEGGRPGGTLARKPRNLGALWLAGPGLRYPAPVFWLALASGVASILFLASRPIPLEKDLRNVHASNSEAIAVQRRIASIFGGGTEPILILVEAGTGAEDPKRSPGEAGTKASVDRLEMAAVEASARLDPSLRALADRGVITAWYSPTHLVPPAEDQRRALGVLEKKDPAGLLNAFDAALEAEGFDPGQFEPARNAFREALGHREVLTPARLREAGLKKEIDQVVGHAGESGCALLAVYPRNELWGSDEQEEIFRTLEEMLATSGVRGELAGTLAISSKTARSIVAQFAGITLSAWISTLLLVFILFRNRVWALLALLPVTLGTLWTGALCELLGVKLNFMNVGILPMVIGISVDNGIHLVSRYADSRTPRMREVILSTGGAVMLTSLTTLGGFGIMLFSTNRGIGSVGAISAIGITSCLVASLAVLPAAMELSARGRISGAAGPEAPR